MYKLFICFLVLLVPSHGTKASPGPKASQDYFSNILSSITPETISKFLKNIGQAFGDLIPCRYACNNGGYPVPKAGYQPQDNGCGQDSTLFTKELAKLIPPVNACCSEHDRCYGTCNSVRSDCDNKLRQCLKDTCGMAKEIAKVVKTDMDVKGMCLAAANGLYAAVTSVGCPAYLKSQDEACVCIPKPDI